MTSVRRPGLSRLPLPETHAPASQLLFGSEQGLLLTRSVVFCCYALVAALITLLQQGKAITRDTLRTPFSIQAFLVAPFVVLVSAGTLLVRIDQGGTRPVGGALAAFACLWYLWARASAYRAMVDSGWAIALLRVGLAFAATTIALLVLMAAILR